MPRRSAPDPDVVAPLLDDVARAAALVKRRERALAQARKGRDDAIRAALAADVPPTHAQLADAAGVTRGYIGQL